MEKSPRHTYRSWSSIWNRFSVRIVDDSRGEWLGTDSESKRGRATRDVLWTKGVRAIFVDSVFPCTIKRSISRGVFRSTRPPRFFIRHLCQGKILPILAVIPSFSASFVILSSVARRTGVLFPFSRPSFAPFSFRGSRAWLWKTPRESKMPVVTRRPASMTFHRGIPLLEDSTKIDRD